MPYQDYYGPQVYDDMARGHEPIPFTIEPDSAEADWLWRLVEQATVPAPELGAGYRRSPRTGRAVYSARWL